MDTRKASGELAAGRGPAAMERDCRCACGALMARRTPAGVELKCRRCKRTWRLFAENFVWVESSTRARPEDSDPRAVVKIGEIPLI
jgi:phage FluMu protein Com